MFLWFTEMGLAGQIFALIATPFTVMLVLQTVMLLFGLASQSGSEGGNDMDTDTDSDGDFDTDGDFDLDTDSDLDGFDGHVDGRGLGSGNVFENPYTPAYDPGLRIFTIRGFVSFFTIFGWSGVACVQAGMQMWLVMIISLSAGILATVLTAWALKAAMKMQINGTTDLRNAVGKTGVVYLRIPAERNQRGKVNVIVQNRLTEIDAVTDDDEDISTGNTIVVVGMSDQTTVVVTAKR